MRLTGTISDEEAIPNQRLTYQISGGPSLLRDLPLGYGLQ
jgi:hypothetical protein